MIRAYKLLESPGRPQVIQRIGHVERLEKSSFNPPPNLSETLLRHQTKKATSKSGPFGWWSLPDSNRGPSD